MDVTNLLRIILDNIAKQLGLLIPGTTIIPGDSLCWSPKSQSITYRKNDDSPENVWGLFHEAGHAQLNHVSYGSDIELLLMEVAAWENAIDLAGKLDQEIDVEHIQDCLDTYRDWLHQRSTCPRCGIVSFQESTDQYSCFNCGKDWSVSPSRLCRPYRLSSEYKKNRPEKIPQAVFQARSST